MGTFKIGINMAGAISAGAYTAGVLDFLTEALDVWYAAKKAGRPVPMHDVSIEVFSGASAGGMCAAISAVMLQTDFEHIHDTNVKGTSNRFFESWVNKIDIRHLLQAEDLKGPVVSLLDSTIIEEIATYALAPGTPMKEPRPYVSPELTLFLSLTNLRGIPYSLNDAAPGSIEESALFHGDHIRFQTKGTQPAGVPNPTVRMLDMTVPGAQGGWKVLQTAAMATGAFPVFLAPRILERSGCEYIPAHWHSVTSEESEPLPNFPKDFKEPFETLNVDGGVTNNDPFNFAHDYLLDQDPIPDEGKNPREPVKADRAVITVAPFPAIDPFAVNYDAKASSSVFSALPKLFSALISQSRFFGESLNDIMGGTTFSRFIIAPSDEELTKEHLEKGTKKLPALQCASLGAFGGFFEREFRAHDYALGRRNCQKFLQESFVLPVTNPLIAEGLTELVKQPEEFERYKRPAPGTYGMTAEELKAKGLALPLGQKEAGMVWVPIIPLCTQELWTPVPRPIRAKLKKKDLDEIVKLIMGRFKGLTTRFINDVPSSMFRWFLRAGQPFIRWRLKGPLTKTLITELGDDYQA